MEMAKYMLYFYILFYFLTQSLLNAHRFFFYFFFPVPFPLNFLRLHLPFIVYEKEKH
ncbi:uncharacterized protein RNJ42_01708 [Nakaseomyces bracarensis]|uniref:uncharacterized protein n=1 Tax=Nakaseomyces bracarensis TaxID=273131 RepID=UPI003871625E